MATDNVNCLIISGAYNAKHKISVLASINRRQDRRPKRNLKKINALTSKYQTVNRDTRYTVVEETEINN